MDEAGEQPSIGVDWGRDGELLPLGALSCWSGSECPARPAVFIASCGSFRNERRMAPAESGGILRGKAGVGDWLRIGNS